MDREVCVEEAFLMMLGWIVTLPVLIDRREDGEKDGGRIEG